MTAPSSTAASRSPHGRRTPARTTPSWVPAGRSAPASTAGCCSRRRQRAAASPFAGTAAHADPVSVSAYYLVRVPSRAGDACAPRCCARGRSMSTALGAPSCRPTATAASVERIRALATYGDLGGAARRRPHHRDRRRTSRRPRMLSAARRAAVDFMEQAGLLERLDLRLDPACVGWAVGKPSGRGPHPGLAADGRRPRARPAPAAARRRRAARRSPSTSACSAGRRPWS